MQNTNTNDTNVSTPSSLAEEKRIAMRNVSVKGMKNSSSSLEVITPQHGFLHKLLMFFAKIFTKKPQQALPHSIELVSVPEQIPAAAQVAVSRPTLAVLHIQPMKPPVAPENIRRKIAEQEFHAMDITHATMN